MGVLLQSLYPEVMNMREVNNVCDSLVAFEEQAASIYRTFALRFAEDHALSAFWWQMSMEERQHAQLLRFCGCEQLLSRGLPDESTVQDFARVLHDLEERSTAINLSRDQAFQIAAELEGSEINDVFGAVVKPVEGTWHIIRKKIETLQSPHLETLANAALKFGASAPTLAAMAKRLQHKVPSVTARK